MSPRPAQQRKGEGSGGRPGEPEIFPLSLPAFSSPDCNPAGLGATQTPTKKGGRPDAGRKTAYRRAFIPLFRRWRIFMAHTPTPGNRAAKKKRHQEPSATHLPSLRSSAVNSWTLRATDGVILGDRPRDVRMTQEDEQIVEDLPDKILPWSRLRRLTVVAE